MKRELLVVCGPTATGKTGLGVYLARQFNGEIVSADSRQVHKGMDIGTGKDLPVNSKFKIQSSNQENKTENLKIGYYLINEVPVWLYDVVEPDYRFNVANYIGCAKRVIEDIWKREKLPIVVGGTGFYIKAMIDGIETLGISPDWELRWRLKNLPSQELFNLLARFDPEKAALMNLSDRQNPRRLIRAIEIANQSSAVSPQSSDKKLEFDNLLIVGLRAPNQILYQRIDQRVEKRIEQGIEKEIKALLKKGYSWQNSALGQTLAYQEWRPFFKGEATKEQIIQRWKYDEHAYARRQTTWFKKDKRINWFDINKRDWQEKAVKIVDEWKKNN